MRIHGEGYMMKKKIRIVHLGYMHRYDDTRILKKECRALKKALEADVFYLTSNRLGNFEGELVGVNVKTLTLEGRRVIRYLKYLKDLYKEAINLDANIYHIHEPYLLPLVKNLKKLGKKVIYDKHENTLDDSIQKFQKKFGKRIGSYAGKKFYSYEKKKIEKCNLFLYVNPQYEKDGGNIKSMLLPNFPRLDTKSLERKVHSDFILCYCGGISEKWNILELTKIVIENTNAKLKLAGKVAPTYLERIMNYNIDNRIEYYGLVDYSKVLSIYSESDAGIALLDKNLGNTLKEGTLANTKIFEYMQSGLPVIFTDFPLWNNILKEYKFGIPVDIKSKKQIIDAINLLMNDSREAENFGLEGKKAVREKYNWDKYEEKFIEMYGELINERG